MRASFRFTSCKRNMKVQTIIDLETRRKDLTKYPIEAIRKAVLNALIQLPK